ncbi:unnamed protein product [Linum trigynum]|uniref:Uncharacterized protein n=1 Tax=Linum trigynum TaxID=586398 RepID=A0AAV2E889_9ROSI
MPQGEESQKPSVHHQMSLLQVGDDRSGEQIVENPPGSPQLHRIGAARLVLVLRTAEGPECGLIMEVNGNLPLCHRHMSRVKPHGLGESAIGQHLGLTSQHEPHVQPAPLASRDHMGEHGVELHAQLVLDVLVHGEQQAPLGVTDEPRHCSSAPKLLNMSRSSRQCGLTGLSLW